MHSATFFTELKRRNVYKVADAYAAVVCLLIQIAATLFAIFEAPVWAMRSHRASAIIYRNRSASVSRGR